MHVAFFSQVSGFLRTPNRLTRFSRLAVAGFLVLLAAALPAALQAGVPPTVSIVSPRDGSVLINTNDLLITVTATDPDGTVAKVALYRDGKFLSQAVSAPYLFDLVNLPAGTNVYTAVATDNDGVETTSSPVTVIEQAPLPPYFKPSVAWVGAATNRTLTAPTNLSLSAAATVYQGNLDRIEFQVVYGPFGDLTLPAGSVQRNPGTLTLTNLAVGTYVVSAVAYDIYGGSAASSPFTVTVLPPAGNPPRFRFTDLGALGTGMESEATGLNAHGDVAGFSTLSSDTSVWNAVGWQNGIPRAHPRGLGNTFGTAINDAGVLMGTLTQNGNPSGAFLWDPIQGYRDLPLLEGRGLNNRGQVVGYQAGDGTVGKRPVLWSAAGSVLLPAPAGGDALAVNERGQVVGYTQANPNGPQHATLWDATGVQDLGTFPELGGVQSIARGLNAAGQVVGSVTLEAPNVHGFLWDSGRMQDLTPMVGCSGWAASINQAGWIVGQTYRSIGFPTVQHAVMWWNGVALDLNALTSDLGDAILLEARAVNDAGQITGVAFSNGHRRAFLLTPDGFQPDHPSPVAILVAPTAATSAEVGTPIPLLASAQAAAGGQLVRVDFYAGDLVVATATNAPYSASWIPTASGQVCLKAVAVDTWGNAGASDPVCLSLKAASPQYLLADLGEVAATATGAGGLNAHGDFVGRTTSSAFVYSGGSVTYLQNPKPQANDAMAINDHGQVLVRTPDGGAAIYQDGSLKRLRNFPGSGSSSLGRDINQAGMVVGESVTDNHDTHAALFTGDSVVDLGTSLGQYSQANAINDLGQIVGWYQTAPGQPVGMFLYDAILGPQTLPPALASVSLQPNDINNLGAIVGGIVPPFGTQSAFLYSNGTLKDLGTLGGLSSVALGLNNSNQVVGSSGGATFDQHAFLFQNGTMTDLNTALPAGTPAILTRAVAINDRGQILAMGHPSLGNSDFRVFLLNPQPKAGGTNQPPTIALQSPSTGAIYREGDDISLRALASDADGTVALVAFYAGTNLLGNAVSQPFTLTWPAVTAGSYSLTTRAYDQLGAASTSAPVTVTVHAFDPAKPAVAILGAAAADRNADVRQHLRDTELFSRVDVIPVGGTNATPSDTQLAAYDAVLVYALGVPSIGAGTSTALAGFLESGRGVVMGLSAANTSNPILQGRFVDQGYLPWTNRLFSSHGTISFLKTLPDHPILSGVATFDGGSNGNYCDEVSPAPGSVVVATWQTHEPLVVARDVAGGRVVGLNFIPVSDATGGIGWGSGTDGARLLANALTWAASRRTSQLFLTASGTNGVAHTPDEAVTLRVTGTNLPAGGTVQLYDNGLRITTLTGLPASYTWTGISVGNHQVTAVYQDGAGNSLASPSVSVPVDSRLNLTWVAPTNSSVVYLPASLLLQVVVSDLDAPIVQVDYFLDGAQRIGTATTPPYDFNFTRFAAGILNLSAVVTDTLGARRTSPTVHVTVINNALSHQTEWTSISGDWWQPTNWSAAPPRPQDRALLNLGTATLPTGTASATNLTLGSSAKGILLQTGGTLTIAKEFFLGDTAAGSGSFRLTPPGRLDADQLVVGVSGTGSVEQAGGTVAVNQLILGANGGPGGTYTLTDGVLTTATEQVSGLAPGLFRQSGGTHSTKEFTIGHNAAVAGIYQLSAGLLETDYELIGATGIFKGTRSAMNQSGGTNRVHQELRLGVQGAIGTLGVTGGVLQTTRFIQGSDGLLLLVADPAATHLRVDGNATLGGILTVSLPDGYTPLGGDAFNLMTYGSLDGQFALTNLPPSSNGVIWTLECQPNAMVLRALPPPQILIVSPFSADPEAGLVHQLVTVSNHGTDPLRGARIYFPGLPAGWQVYNAAGIENGVPYLEIDTLIPSNTSIQVEAQFLIPDGSRPIPLNYAARLGQVTQLDSGPLPLELDLPMESQDGRVTLPLVTQRNHRYSIQYSDDLVHWSTVAQPIVAAGSRTQWVDDGPPKTSRAPSTRPTRYYRAIEAE